MLVLYDLVGENDNSFSPHCWRTRLALAHKGLKADYQPRGFTQISSIADGTFKTLPIVEDDGQVIVDSWAIANHLEEKYTDRPLTLFIQNWTGNVVFRGMFDLIVLDIYQSLSAEDQTYFRESRERMLGRSLEDVQAGREQRVTSFRQSLSPLRALLKEQNWLGGAQPLYADYIVFAALQWARAVSKFPLLEADDPINTWFERGLDLYDGLARRSLQNAA